MSFISEAKVEPKSESKLCILKAAAKLFAKLGLDKCSTREIAKQADSNISLISYYFGGKEGLYKEVMRSYALEIKSNAQHIVDDMQKADLTVEIFSEYMGKFITNIINTRLKNPEMSQIFSREKLTALPYARDVYEEIFYPLNLNFYKLIETGQKKGFVKKEINPAFLFISMTEGIWGLYELMECDTSLSRDCKKITQDPIQFKNQILSIYLTGVLK